MVEFFREGGFGMFPILFIGLVLLGVALRFAVRPDRDQVGFLACISGATLLASAHATWLALGAVFATLSRADKVPDGVLVRTLIEGLKESTRPGGFGGGVLTLAFILFSIGAARMRRTGARAEGGQSP
jgi:hypothetical protein